MNRQRGQSQSSTATLGGGGGRDGKSREFPPKGPIHAPKKRDIYFVMQEADSSETLTGLATALQPGKVQGCIIWAVRAETVEALRRKTRVRATAPREGGAGGEREADPGWGRGAGGCGGAPRSEARGSPHGGARGGPWIRLTALQRRRLRLLPLGSGQAGGEEAGSAPEGAGTRRHFPRAVPLSAAPFPPQR